MGITFQFDWEVALIQWLQANLMSNTFVLALFSFITDFGDTLFLVLLVGSVYWIYDKKFGVYAAINIIFAIVANSLIKNIFLRRRPYFDNPGIESLKTVDDRYDIYDIKGQGFSFPSGHSCCGAAATLSFYRYSRNRKILAVFSIIYSLVAVSRFALGVHYPTDVIAGLLLGAFCSFAVPSVISRLGKVKGYLIIVVLAASGLLFSRSNDYYSGFGLLCGFCLADLFDERYVDFPNTRNIFKGILRLVFGGALFLGISQVMKMPFSVDFLEAEQPLSYLFRFFRYFITSFIVLGIYPYVFKLNIFKLDDKLKG